MKNTKMLSGLQILTALSLTLFFISTEITAQNFSSKNEIDILLLNEDFKNAAIAIKKAMAKDTANPSLLYKLGLSYKRQSLFSSAIPLFKKCIELDSNITSASLQLADCYSSLGAETDAFGIYKNLFEKDTTNLTAGINLASIYADNQSYMSAINVYKKLIKTDPSNGYLIRQLGVCYGKIDSVNYSVEYLIHALRLNRDDLVALRYLTNFYIKNELFPSAEITLKNRIKTNPENLTVNKLLGETYFSWKRYDSAAKYYSVAIKLCDTSAYTYSKLGVTYYLYAESLDSLQTKTKDSFYRLSLSSSLKSLEKESSPVTLYFLAMASLKLKEYENAADYFNRSHKIFVPSILPELYFHLSESYSGLKDAASAVEALKSALFYKKDSKEILWNIASLYENELADYTQAVQYYNEYLRLIKDDNETVLKVKQKIKKLKQPR
jgi:hypothetical protein